MRVLGEVPVVAYIYTPEDRFVWDRGSPYLGDNSTARVTGMSATGSLHKLERK